MLSTTVEQRRNPSSPIKLKMAGCPHHPATTRVRSHILGPFLPRRRSTMSRAMLQPFRSARAFHSSARRQASHFDTQALVAALEKQGLTRQQAVGVMTALEDVIRDSVSSMVSHLVTRAEVEKYQYTQKVGTAQALRASLCIELS